MVQLVPVSKDRHGGKTWSRFTSLSFAAGISAVPLVAREVPMAALTMPLAFIRAKDAFTLVGLLSLSPGTNLFVGPDGRWLGDYVPSAFRCYPFQVAKKPGDSQEMVFCVDENSGLVFDGGGEEPFFDETGELAKPVMDILEFLKQVEQNRAGTENAVAAMAESGVIADWDLKVKDGDAEKPVKGLYKIDEKKLAELDDQAFLALKNAFALPIAYSQLLSMGNIRVLVKLAQATAQQRAGREPELEGFTLVDDRFRL